MTYIHNLPASAARTLVLAEIQYNPGEPRTEYIFDGSDVGGGVDEEFVVTYVRRRKRSALFDALLAKLDFAPEPMEVPGG